jgi:gliding motility-associated lipoprotein GldH
LNFEIPVTDKLMNSDISFFIRYTKAYEFNDFDFNMIMNTPSGEERTRVFHIDIKQKNGKFCGKCNPDSCETVVVLKNGISLQKKGRLKIEIENLVPRLDLNGVLGAGIRISPHS